jgi:hypothetical protein
MYFACSETNLMHHLFAVYSVTIPLQVSALLSDHHQEVTLYRVIRKCMKHFKHFQQIDYATHLSNSYADRERKTLQVFST